MTTKRNHRTNKNNDRMITITILAIVAIVSTIFTFVAIRYCFHSFMCSWAEDCGNAYYYTASGVRNWSDADVAWYNAEIAAKYDFIEGNLIAGFYNLFSGNGFLKLVRLGIWTAAFGVAAFSWYLIYCVVDAEIKRYHKRAARRAMRAHSYHNVIDFQERQRRQRRANVHAGYYPERKAR